MESFKAGKCGGGRVWQNPIPSIKKEAIFKVLEESLEFFSNSYFWILGFGI
jgi:hypothetical protein